MGAQSVRLWYYNVFQSSRGASQVNPWSPFEPRDTLARNGDTALEGVHLPRASRSAGVAIGHAVHAGRYTLAAMDAPMNRLTASRRFALVAEAVFPFIASQAYIWTVPRDRARWVDIAVGAAIGLVIVAYTRAGGLYGWRQFGLALHGSDHRGALLPVGVFTLGTVAVLLAIGWMTTGRPHGGLRGEWDLLAALLLYPAWGLIQQGVLMGVALPRLRLAGGAAAGVLGAGLLFALAHAPNPLLMAGTLAMGCFYALVWRRYPSLPVIAVSHGIIGAVADKALHVSMRVGSNYLG